MPTFETQGGTSPGVTILNADGTVHTAHTTAGFTEAVAGSGIYNYPHPSPGTLLEFVFDATVGGETLYASVWDDGLTTQGAAEAAIVAKDVSTFDPAADTVAHVTLVDTTTTNTDMRGTDGAATPGDAMTLTAAYDHAKDDVLTPLGEKLTAERLMLIDGVAQEATVAALPEARVGTRIDETSTDSDGDVLGLTTASGEAVGGVRIQAFAVDAAGHIDRSSAIRQTTSRSAVETLEAEERPVGSWELYLPAGTYTLVVTLDGYYDAAEGDSEITRTVVVA
jgi:hypothetical protein